MLPTKTLQEVIDRAVANFRTSFPGLPLGVKRFLGQEARAVALRAWAAQKAVEDLDLDIVPSPRSSSDALDGWASLLGLPNGAGGFGKLVATTASGGAATLTGVKGTSYASGLVAVAEDGTTQVALAGAVSIPGSPPDFGSVAATFNALTSGTAGNLPAGTVCTWVSPPAGADASFTLSTKLSGGEDLESNSAVYARIVARMQTPPRGGMAEDYRIWVQTVGDFVVYAYPRRSGTGSVDVVVTVPGSGQARSTGASSLVTAIDAALAANVPVGAINSFNVLTPSVPSANGHVLRVRVKPFASKFAFDWGAEVDWTATPFTVDTYAAGPPATIKLNTLAPSSLKNAIDAYIAGNGLAPRLQVLSTGAPVNPAIRAVAWSDGGGKTTLTLDTQPAGWTPPATGNSVYPHGPIVDTIAAGELALIDALGPSEQSGYEDPLSPWLDTLSINQMARIAEDALDTDGTPLVSEVLVGGATVDGVAADVEGADHSTDPPELLWASHVAVTP